MHPRRRQIPLRIQLCHAASARTGHRLAKDAIGGITGLFGCF